MYVGKWSEATEKVLDLRPKVDEGAECTLHTTLHTPSNRHVPHMGKPFQLLQISKRVVQQIYYTTKTTIQHRPSTARSQVTEDIYCTAKLDLILLARIELKQLN